MFKKRLITILCIVLFTSVYSFSEDMEKLLQQRVSPNFSGTSLENALKVFARQYSLNLIMSGGVAGNVNVQLYDVTLENALNAILKVNGYHFIVKDDIILVKPFEHAINGELNTKVYKLLYLDGFKLKTTLEPLLSARGKMEALLSEDEEEGKVQRSNILVVTDLWENMREIDRVIEMMDKPSRQIQIEVRLVETVLGDEDRIGIKYPTSIKAGLDGAETTAPISQTGQGGQGGSQRLLSAWYELPEVADDLNFGVISFEQLKATLDILALDKNSRLISNPKVTTMNNKKALIRIGTTIPIPEISRGISGDLFSYKEKDVNMELEVIPQIGDEDLITLKVHPMLEEIIGYTGSAEAPQPITSRREVKTTVIVKDGETVVIGGLVKATENKTVNKVWLLGDIPLLGYLFRHTSIIKEKKDLLIFITTKKM